MRFLGSKYANNAFAAGAPPRTPLGERCYSAPSDPLAGKGGGAAGMAPTRKGAPGKEKGKKRMGGGGGRGKLLI